MSDAAIADRTVKASRGLSAAGRRLTIRRVVPTDRSGGVHRRGGHPRLTESETLAPRAPQPGD